MDDFDIEVCHPSYDATVPKWKTMDDAFEGEDRIKAGGETYLRMKSGMRAMSDKKQAELAYDDYKERAEFPGLVAPTVRGATGLIHDKDTTIELPGSMDYLREKATLAGLTLDGLHREVTTQNLKFGRIGLLAGMGTDGKGQAHIGLYPALSIRNWEIVDGVLSYLVLDESSPQRDPGSNKWKLVTKYRECFAVNGVYTSRLWTLIKSDAHGKKEWQVEDLPVAKTPSKTALPAIPFTFVGTNNNTPDVDDIPLYGLAKLALRIYRLDADFTNTLHMTSEPTPWMSGVGEGALPEAIGANVIWGLEDPHARAGYLEFSGQGAEAQANAINSTFERAIIFGAQALMDDSRAQESGEARGLRLRHQTSTIKNVAVSSASGIQQILRHIGEWSGVTDTAVTVTPNLDFIDRSLSPTEIKAIIEGWLARAYSKRTMFQNLQRGEIIAPDQKFEDEEELISLEEPNLRNDPLDDDDPNDDDLEDKPPGKQSEQ